MELKWVGSFFLLSGPENPENSEENGMIDIKFLRNNPEAVRENICKKYQEEKLPLVDQDRKSVV